MHPALALDEIVLQVLALCSCSSALHLGQSCKELWRLARGVVWSDIPDLDIISSLVQQHPYHVGTVWRNLDNTFDATPTVHGSDTVDTRQILEVPDLRQPLPLSVTTYLNHVKTLQVTQPEWAGKNTLAKAPSWAILNLLTREEIRRLFPSLRSLHIRLRYDTGFSTAAILLIPNLREVRFQSIGGCYCCGPFLGVDHVAAFIDQVTVHATELRSLSVAWNTFRFATREYHEPLYQSVIKLLNARSHLQDLRLKFAIADDVFGRVAKLHNLRCLELNCRWLTTFPTDFIGHKAFLPNLRDLYLDYVNLSIALDCCSTLNESHIERLAIWLIDYDEVVIGSLCQAIANHCTYLKKLDLRYNLPGPNMDSDEFLAFLQTMSPEPVEIPWTVFKPLISCGSLDSLFLSFAYHICVTDEDLEDLARALPNLRKLAFCGKLVRRAYYPERHSHVQPDVTTYGLLALVQHCPELRSITLPLSMGFGPPSADDTQFNQRPRPIFKQLKKPLKWFKSIRAVKQANRPDTSSNAGAEATAIEADDNEELCYPVAAHVSDLEVSYSPDPGNAQQTATFLRQVFPHLERLHHEVMWSQDPPRDEYSAREEQRKKRWAEVKQVLGLEKGGITVYNMNWLPLSWE